MDYGDRPDGSKKGSGYLGEIKRPDGRVRSLKTGPVRYKRLLSKWVQDGKYWTHRIRLNRTGVRWAGD